MTGLMIDCPQCNRDGFVSAGDRHTETAKDVCPTCKGRMQVPARTGETPHTSVAPATPPGVPDSVREASEAATLAEKVKAALAQKHVRQLGPNPLPSSYDLYYQLCHLKDYWHAGYSDYLTYENLILWLTDFAAALLSTHPAGQSTGQGVGLGAYLARQMAWSQRAFGDRSSAIGLTKHIEKECAEIRANPRDLVEWVDVVMLALDGYWRHGGTPADIMPTLLGKLAKNEAREWPVNENPDEPNEHDRSDEPAPDSPLTGDEGTEIDLFDRLHVEPLVREWCAPVVKVGDLHAEFVDGLVGVLRRRLNRAARPAAPEAPYGWLYNWTDDDCDGGVVKQKFSRVKPDAANPYISDVMPLFDVPTSVPTPVIDVQPMRLSSGKSNYFVRVRCGGREQTLFKLLHRHQAQYTADELSWLLGLREEKPELMAYDDTTHPDD